MHNHFVVWMRQRPAHSRGCRPRRIDKVHRAAQNAGLPTRPFGFFVANTASAEKAARQAEKHRARNIALRSRMRSAIRSVNAAIAAGNKDSAQTSYKAATPVIDALVNKQIVHRNKAARHKSRLAASIRKMQ
jgi:small subunit ribosomal protein S20